MSDPIQFERDADYSEPHQGLSYGGIVVGVVTDVVASIVLGLVVGIVMGIAMARPGMAPEQLQQQLFNNPFFFILTSAVGVIGCMIGGFVAAKIAKRDGWKHGLITGVLSVALAVALILAGPEDPTPMWANITTFSLSIPAAALGGYFGCSKNVNLYDE